jgi:hypothetical protein
VADTDPDRRLLDAVADHADELADLPLAGALTRLRQQVQETLTTRRPDDSWPPEELLAEVLQAHLDLLDDRLAAEGVTVADLPGDTRWIDATRTAVTHPDTLAALLAELRAGLEPRPRAPTYPPPPELQTIVEP